MRLTFLMLLGLVASAFTSPVTALSQGTLSISGTVWEDENADGVRQPGERGIRFQWLTPDRGGEQVGRVLTGEGGAYRFDGLSSGRYTVLMEGGEGHVLTHPEREYAGPIEVTVNVADASVSNVDFGLHAPTGVPHFRGLVWVDAELPIVPDVRAFVGAVDCTGPYRYVIPPGADIGFAVSVLSEDLKPGCGTPGDEITFTVDGRRANETAPWETPVLEFPAAVGENLTLTVGAPFAYFNARLKEDGEPGFGLSQRLVVAMIDGTVCAAERGGGFGNALIGVPSEEQVPGCGRPGKVITFAVDGFAVPEVVLWQNGERPDAAFTFEPSRDAPLAGPAFAYYEVVPESDQETLRVNAYVGDVFCGGTIGEAGDTLLLAVAPDELIEGCGREGVLVTLWLNEQVLGEPVPWQPGFHDGPDVSNDDVESPPLPDSNHVTPPDTGGAGLKR